MQVQQEDYFINTHVFPSCSDAMLERVEVRGKPATSKYYETHVTLKFLGMANRAESNFQ